MIAKILLSSSAILLGIVGLVINFAPGEAALRMGLGGQPAANLLLQIFAALLLAMAVLNWMTRSQKLGGIYNKPLALANALHFTVGAFALIRALTSGLEVALLLSLTIVYVVFAIGFLWAVFLAQSPVTAPSAGR